MCDTANGLCGAGRSCGGVVGGVAERVDVSDGEKVWCVTADFTGVDPTWVDALDGLSPRAFLKRFLNPFAFSGDGAGALDWDRGDGRAVLVAEAIGPGWRGVDCLDVGLGDAERGGAGASGLDSLSRDRSEEKDPRAVGSPASDRFGGRGAALAGESSDKVREWAVGAGLLALRLLAGEGVRESGEGRTGWDCDLGKEVETEGADADADAAADMFSREGLWLGPLRL
jgi:hypothetical protein